MLVASRQTERMIRRFLMLLRHRTCKANTSALIRLEHMAVAVKSVTSLQTLLDWFCITRAARRCGGVNDTAKYTKEGKGIQI